MANTGKKKITNGKSTASKLDPVDFMGLKLALSEESKWSATVQLLAQNHAEATKAFAAATAEREAIQARLRGEYGLSEQTVLGDRGEINRGGPSLAPPA